METQKDRSSSAAPRLMSAQEVTNLLKDQKFTQYVIRSLLISSDAITRQGETYRLDTSVVEIPRIQNQPEWKEQKFTSEEEVVYAVIQALHQDFQATGGVVKRSAGNA